MFAIPSSGKPPKPRVLEGNWQEEHLALEMNTKEFVEKQESMIRNIRQGKVPMNNQLKWSNMSNHINHINQPYIYKDRQSKDRPIKFGDLVQIKSKMGLTLTFDMWTTTFVPTNSGPKLGKKEFIVLASKFNGESDPPPISRNVFQISKVAGEDYPDEILRQGMKFQLIAPSERFDKKYAIKSIPANMAKMAFENKIEVVLSQDISSYDAVWQVKSIDKNSKSWQHTPVHGNTKCLLNHCSTNAFLGLPTQQNSQYILDNGCQVFSTTDIDKRSLDLYQWSIIPLDLS